MTRARPVPSSQVLAAAATGFANHVTKQGGDAEAILANLNLTPDDILEPTKAVSLATYCQMLENASESTRNADFGLGYGRHFGPEMLGLIGFLALASPNAGSALQNFIELFPCHQNGTETRIQVTDDLVRMEYRILDPAIIDRRQDAEFTMCLYANLAQRCLGTKWTPVRVDFEHPAPPSFSMHHNIFDADVAFGQATNALTLRTVALDTLMPGGNLHLADVLRSSLRALACSSVSSDIVTRARAEIRGRLASQSVILPDIADRLGVPTWTLQRRLSDEGLTFSTLIDEVRKDLAKAYLTQPHIPLSEIAYLLGYSEQSAFSRAYRNWYGMSPQARRRLA